jgi:nitroimidazol reductase NimA-like FMN-containing flavoprotein (pyridoxamine 5'-phosphate oxidase superfamily)
MRRKEKEITEQAAIESIIQNSLVCRVGMVDRDRPYVVPVCFGYRDRAIYMHGSLKGKKIDVLKKNPNVCFELDINAEVVRAENACDWGMKFQSIIGFGKAVFMNDPDKKREALDLIMRHYSGHSSLFPDSVLKATAVIKIEINRMTGKQSGF